MIEMDNNTFMAIAVVAPIAGYVCTQFARRPRRDTNPVSTSRKVTAPVIHDDTERILTELAELRDLLEREARRIGLQVTETEDRGRM